MIESLNVHLPDLLRALGQTGAMVSISLFAAVVIGLPLGTLIYLSREGGMRPNRTIWAMSEFYVTVVRSFPFLLFIVFLIPLTRAVVGTSFGTVAGAFPLCFVGIAITARLTEQILLEIPPGIPLIAKAMGANTRQIVFRFLLVEGRSGLMYAFTSVTVTLISYSTVLGVVGAGGIGDFAMRYGYQNYDWLLMYLAVGVTVVCVLLIQLLGHKLSAVLDKR